MLSRCCPRISPNMATRRGRRGRRLGRPPFARTRTCVRSSVMWLAGIPVADRAVLHLAASLREAELVATAELLERAYDREARIVALEVATARRSSACSRTAPRNWSSCGRRSYRSTCGASAKGSPSRLPTVTTGTPCGGGSEPWPRPRRIDGGYSRVGDGFRPPTCGCRVEAWTQFQAVKGEVPLTPAETGTLAPPRTTMVGAGGVAEYDTTGSSAGQAHDAALSRVLPSFLGELALTGYRIPHRKSPSGLDGRAPRSPMAC